MRFSTIAASCFALTAVAQQCGPDNNNQICAPNNCCSQYGWCDTGAAWCDPTSCLSEFSGPGSTCAGKTSAIPIPPKSTAKSTAKTTTKTATPTSTPVPSKAYASSIPVIDVCGSGSDTGVSCPGAGSNGYFYRCCSSGGHCGPKNNLQDQSLYCGSGCQGGFGDCSTDQKAPALPSGAPKIATTGQTCGPIVNAKCATGLCCSGSNFCGTGEEFCGSANWCQAKWGHCTQTTTVYGGR